MYLENAGKQNTDLVLRIAKEAALKRGIDSILVASTTGETGLRLCGLMKRIDIRVIVITHNTGFKEEGKQEIRPEIRKKIEELGGVVLTCPMVLRGVGCAIREKGGYSHEQLVADTLRMFGQGTKVCVEMAAMASDCGLIPPRKDVICVAGTGRGADTCVIIHPASSNRFFDIKVKEFLCKPREF